MVFALMLVTLVVACRTQPWTGFPALAPTARVWPTAPEQARIGWVMQIRSQEDLFNTRGIMRNLGELVGGKPDTSMQRPYALALHPAGGLLVSDPGRRRVHYYDWGRQRYFAIGLTMAEGLPSPVGVAALPGGEILVADSRLRQVLRFSRDGKPLGVFAGRDTVERPAGLAVDASRGEVYVADVLRHRIVVLSLDGRLVRNFGQRGGGPNDFNFPTHLALDGAGRLVVTDSMNFRVKIHASDGALVRTFGQLGGAPGQFSKPKGVAVDQAGHTIVVEGLHDALQFFDGQGRLLLSLGSSGASPGEFWLPAGLAFDPAEGLLFVADSYNGRVQVFRMLEGGE